MLLWRIDKPLEKTCRTGTAESQSQRQSKPKTRRHKTTEDKTLCSLPLFLFNSLAKLQILNVPMCDCVCVGRKQLTLLLCALAAPLFALLLLLLPPPPPFAAVAVAAAVAAAVATASVGHWLSTHFSFRCGKE